ncbi:Protein UGT-49, partial [Aphelenchoides avenae]
MVEVKALVATANIASSHVQFAGRLADLLVEAGHEAHMFVTVWDPKIDGCGAMQAQKVRRYVPTNADEIHALNGSISFKNDYFGPRKETFCPEQAKLFARGNYLFFKAIMSDWKLLDELRAEHYNVGIADDACSVALFHFLEIPCTIFISPVSVSRYWHPNPLPQEGILGEFISHPLGLSSPPSYVAEVNTAPCSAPYMSISERAINLYRTMFRTPRILRIFDSTMTSQMRQIVPSMPSFSELLQRTSLVFVNSHYLLDTARPLAHKVKQIGGVAVPEPKELNN